MEIVANNIGQFMDELRKAAMQFGWSFKSISYDNCVMFIDRIKVGNREQIAIYWKVKQEEQIISGHSHLLTVGTALNHPKQGKTQLFRRRQSVRQLLKVFENPRFHTGKGYYRK